MGDSEGLVFKIVRGGEWPPPGDAYDGSQDDGRDGFIHLSTAAQVEGTLARHFAGEQGLLLIAVDARALGAALRWEASRDGALFPHLYGPLPLSAVRSVRALP
ncbi:MAG: DUF952 domain-containing protein [Alphaproteobacteria bacterium]|nr:DUF952 domain-containing protein [Alphaproteobacteria bacterium]